MDTPAYFAEQIARVEAELAALGLPTDAWKAITPWWHENQLNWKYALVALTDSHGKPLEPVQLQRKATRQLGGADEAAPPWLWAQIGALAGHAVRKPEDATKAYNDISDRFSRLQALANTRDFHSARASHAARRPRQRSSPQLDAVVSAIRHLQSLNISVNPVTIAKFFAENNGPTFRRGTLRQYISRARKRLGATHR